MCWWLYAFKCPGIGVMRTAVIHEDLLTDGVPVDTCANLTIAAAWSTDREFRWGSNNNNDMTMIAINDGFRSYQMTNVRLVDDC